MIGFSAGAAGREGNVDRMVKTVLDGSGHDAEFVKLSDLDYSGCKGCVHLCAQPQVCKLDDDLLPYYQKIKDADAVVVGHTVQSGVNRRYSGKVIGIDVLHPNDDHKLWPEGHSEALLIEGDKYYRVFEGGRKEAI